MLIQYRPEDPSRGDPRDWDFDPKHVLSDECELIEKHYGAPWDVFAAKLRIGDTKARRLLLWHLMRRDHNGPGLHVNLKDVPNFYSGELIVQMSSKEVLEFRKQIAKSKALDDLEREQALGAMDTEYEEALEREGLAEHEGHATVDGQVVDAPAPGEPRWHEPSWTAGTSGANRADGSEQTDPLPAASLTSGDATG